MKTLSKTTRTSEDGQTKTVVYVIEDDQGRQKILQWAGMADEKEETVEELLEAAESYELSRAKVQGTA